MYKSIDKFKDGTKESWEKCDCEEFKKDYCMSMLYYTLVSFIMIILMSLKLIVGCYFCCYDERPDDSPENVK